VAKHDRPTGLNRIGDLSDPALIATLTGWLQASGASALEIATPDGGALKIVLDAGPHVAPVEAVSGNRVEDLPQGRPVKAPMAGLFRDRHPGLADAGPLAGAGKALEAGAVAGFVEVGPVLLPVVAPAAGVTAEIHARVGALIGYGDAVLTMEPAP
jgi:acetyl-CoA carboxylase biotin carboxyl carrier protein